jgi:hypothetical protein
VRGNGVAEEVSLAREDAESTRKEQKVEHELEKKKKRKKWRHKNTNLLINWRCIRTQTFEHFHFTRGLMKISVSERVEDLDDDDEGVNNEGVVIWRELVDQSIHVDDS